MATAVQKIGAQNIRHAAARTVPAVVILDGRNLTAVSASLDTMVPSAYAVHVLEIVVGTVPVVKMTRVLSAYVIVVMLENTAKGSPQVPYAKKTMIVPATYVMGAAASLGSMIRTARTQILSPIAVPGGIAT